MTLTVLAIDLSAFYTTDCGTFLPRSMRFPLLVVPFLTVGPNRSGPFLPGSMPYPVFPVGLGTVSTDYCGAFLPRSMPFSVFEVFLRPV
jgi:hypothetical protein